MEELNERLKEIRRLKGLKQKEMAKKLNLCPSAYSKIESGKVDLSTKNLLKICNIFEDISAEWLLTGTRNNGFYSFGEYSQDVRQMLLYMTQNKADMHALLSHFYQLKNRSNFEELRTQEI